MPALLLLLAVALTSCVSTGTKVDEAVLPQFQRGVSTFYDVQAALGKPTVSTIHADGSRQFVYSYTQTQWKPESYIPIVAMFVQGTTAETSQVVFDFDPRGVLVYVSSTQGQAQTGTGFFSGGRQ